MNREIHMNMKLSHFTCLLTVSIFSLSLLAFAAEQESIQLPEPDMTGGKPLMQALKNRSSTKKFDTKKLSSGVMSNLLWASWGINRPESGKRTAPSAMNKQEIDIYVLTADGAYQYDAKAHALNLILKEDLRAKIGGEGILKTAAINLLFVMDFSKSGGKSEEERKFYATITTGCIIQNVYLFCASEGLATFTGVATGGQSLGKAIGLHEGQKALMSQTVGYVAD